VRRSYQLLAPALIAGCLAAPLAGHAGDEIRTYTVPKERLGPVPQAAAAIDGDTAMPAADIPVSSARATWTTPGTWKELAPTSLRVGNFAVAGPNGAKAEAAIFSFRGTVGTELDNVNRWRNELKLPPIEPDKIPSEPVTIDSMDGRLYEITSAGRAIVAASLPRAGDTWVFKMWGDKAVVVDAEPVFRNFLKTVHITAAPSATPSATVNNEVADNPHGELAAAAPEAGSPDGPKWNAPANWTETDPGAMVFKKYSVTGAGGGTGVVSVSVFQGGAGGTLINVNRWRGQMSLPPVAQEDLGNVAQSLEIAGDRATLVDFSGTDRQSGQAARLVALIVPHGESTWYYKLTGDGPVVQEQRENFMKFVKTARYP
jgi:hypothetical protein